MTNKIIKAGVALAIFSTVAFSGTAIAEAANISSPPANIENAAQSYIASRMVETRGARYQVKGNPYPVSAELRKGQKFTCWAMDIKVRSNGPGAARSVDTYTVLFHNGRAVALKRDLRKRIVKLDMPQRYAAN